MKRKLVAQGSGKGFVLYVPKKWTDKKELEAGDYLDIEETEEGNLLIKSEKFDRNKKTSVIHITEKNKQFIKSIINSTYRLGYEKVIIKYNEQKELKKLEEIIMSELLGFEIISKSNKEIIIENITEPGDQKEEVLLRRMFMLLVHSYELLEESIEKKNFSYEKNIKSNSEKIAQFGNFCRRSVSKNKIEKESLHWLLFTYIHLNQRGIVHFYKNIIDNKLEFNEVELNLIKQIRLELSNIVKGFFGDNLDLVDNSNKILNKMNRSILNNEINIKDKNIFHFIADQSRLTYLSTTSIIGLLI